MVTTTLKRRWLKRLATFALLLLVLLAAAPWLVARSGIVQSQIRKGLADFDGSVEVGKVSLGWFSPVVVENITLKDRAGRTIADLPKVSSSAKLLHLIASGGNLGTLTLEQPSLEIVCENGSTNLEESLKKMLEKPGDAKTPKLRIEAVNAKLKVIDAENQKHWSFENVSLAADLGDVTKVKLDIPGVEKLAADVTLSSPPSGEITMEKFPLAVAGPILRRFDAKLALDGALSGTMKSNDGTLEGSLNVNAFQMSAAKLNGKTVSLQAVALPVKLTWSGTRLNIENAAVRCELGSVSVAGAFDTNTGIESLLRQPGITVAGRAELAKLSATMPELFKLKPGMTITQGAVDFQLASIANAGGTQWNLTLDSTDFQAARERLTPLVWPKPLAAKGIVRFDDRNNPKFENFSLKSDFANLNINGTLESLEAAGNLDLNRFLAKFDEFFDRSGLALGGTAQFRVKGQGTADAFAVEADALLTQFRFTGFGLDIDEPLAQLLPTQIRYDRKAASWQVPAMQFRSESVAFSLTNFEIVGGQPRGTVALNANLARLQKMFGLDEPLIGMIRNGTIDFQTRDGGLQVAANLPMNNFSYGTPANPDWFESSMTVVFQGLYVKGDQKLTVTNAAVQRADGSTLRLGGTVTGLADKPTLDLAGTLDYNLAGFEPQFRSLFGTIVNAVGRGSKPVSVKGPIDDMKLLTAEAAFDWQSLKMYGFEFGPAGFHVVLHHNAFQAGMIETTLNRSGRVRLQPTLHLNSGAYDLTLAKGRIVDHATLTPQATAEALGYALPAIAKSTQAEGTLSIDLGEHRIPTVALAKTSLQGQIQLHDVKVVAGPVMTKIATLFGMNQPQIVLKKEQLVEVIVKDGRVYHKNLGMTVGKFTFSTSGSVGFDNTLNLDVTVPVPDGAVAGLLANAPAVQAAIAKKTFTVKVTGTMDNPKIDEQAFRKELANFTAEVLKDSVKNKLGGFLQPKNP